MSTQSATRSRPVNARASFTAPVFAVEPSFVNLTISARVTRPRKVSAASSSSLDGRTKFVPFVSCAATASETAG